MVAGTTGPGPVLVTGLRLAALTLLGREVPPARAPRSLHQDSWWGECMARRWTQGHRAACHPVPPTLQRALCPAPALLTTGTRTPARRREGTGPWFTPGGEMSAPAARNRMGNALHPKAGHKVENKKTSEFLQENFSFLLSGAERPGWRPAPRWPSAHSPAGAASCMGAGTELGSPTLRGCIPQYSSASTRLVSRMSLPWCRPGCGKQTPAHPWVPPARPGTAEAEPCVALPQQLRRVCSTRIGSNASSARAQLRMHV